MYNFIISDYSILIDVAFLENLILIIIDLIEQLETFFDYLKKIKLSKIYLLVHSIEPLRIKINK
jgi:hypothetical protein